MEQLSGQRDALRSITAVKVRVASDAKRAYQQINDDAFFERCADSAVDELWPSSVKVTTFIPVLAMRRIRDMVDQHHPPATKLSVGAM